MFRQPRYLFISAVAWAGFIAVTVWTMLFLADVVVSPTVDGPSRTNAAAAVTVDLALLMLFAFQHSAMARPQVKAWSRRRISPPLERSSYVLATDACLLVIVVLWQPWGGQVWQVRGPAGVIVWSLGMIGWILAIASTFAVDHLELTGLRQAGWSTPRDAVRTNRLEIGGLHAIVRHPLMTGLLLALWATPHMGASHLLFATAMTVYIAIGIRFEERDLRRTFADYDAYAARVPALLPGVRLQTVRRSSRRPRRTSAAERVSPRP